MVMAKFEIDDFNEAKKRGLGIRRVGGLGELYCEGEAYYHEGYYVDHICEGDIVDTGIDNDNRAEASSYLVST